MKIFFQSLWLHAARDAKLHVVSRASVLCNDSKLWPLNMTLAFTSRTLPPPEACHRLLSFHLCHETWVCRALPAWLCVAPFHLLNENQHNTGADRVSAKFSLHTSAALGWFFILFFFVANLCLICISLSLLIQPHTTHTHTHTLT